MPRPFGRLALPWLPAFWGLGASKQTIWLTSLQPFTGGVWDAGLSQTVGGILMLEHINNHSNLLKDYELKILWQDDMCSAGESTRIFNANVFDRKYFPFVPNRSLWLEGLDVDGDGVIETEDALLLAEEWNETQVSPRPVGLLGPGCSGPSLKLVDLAHWMRYPVVSNSASSPALSNRAAYPNFFRTVLPDASFFPGWLSFAKMLGQHSVVGVVAETGTWQSMAETFTAQAEILGVEMVGQTLSWGFKGVQVSFQSESIANEAAKLLIRYKQRVVVLFMYEARARLVMCACYKQGLRHLVFMPFGWFSGNWWTATDTSCTPQQLTQTAQGFVSAIMLYWRFDRDTVLSCSETMTSQGFREEVSRRQFSRIGEYVLNSAGFIVVPDTAVMADAVCMYAQALDALLVGRGFPYEELVAHSDRFYSEIVELLGAVDFDGVTGRIKFEPNSADQSGRTLLQQLQVGDDGNGRPVDIASASVTGEITFFGSADLIFGLPGEQVFAGPAGASSISLNLTEYTVCGGSATLDFETNTCVECPVGTVFLEIVQECICQAGYALINGTCSKCGLGTAAPTDGMAQCLGCAEGTFSDQVGSTSCSSCPKGRFVEESLRSVCKSCESEFGGQGMTTEVLGATRRSECRCGGNTYQSASSRACVPCPEGMECSFGSDMSQNSTIRPVLLPLFWSDPQEPLSVFRCESAQRCPGGQFGTCAPHTFERACAHCSSGRSWDGNQCSECSAIARSWFLFPVLPLLLIPIIILILYRLFSDSYAMWGSWQNGLAGTVFILLNYAQIVALMQSVQLDLPSAVVRFFKLTAFANELTQAFSPQCSGYQSFADLQAIGIMAPAIVLVIAFLCWLSAKGLARLTRRTWLVMERDRTWNVAMSLIYTFFTSIVSTSCTLFKCETNPNGTRSLVADRSILCFADEWWGLLFMEIIGILWCIIGVALFARAVFHSSVMHFFDEAVQQRWKFLFIKYRPDVHWWSLVFMARAVLMNVGMIALDASSAKLYWLMVVFMVYLAALSIFRPWRHRINNLVDGFTQLCLTVIASLFTWSAIEANDVRVAMGRLTLAVFILILLLTVVLAISMVWTHCSDTKAKDAEEVKEIISAFQRIGQAEDEELQRFLKTLGEWDTSHMRVAKNIIMTEFFKVSSRRGLSQHNLSARGPKRSVDWDSVDRNTNRSSTDLSSSLQDGGRDRSSTGLTSASRSSEASGRTTSRNTLGFAPVIAQASPRVTFVNV